MNRCLITYELCGPEKYSLKGLRMITPKLTSLNDLPFSAAEQSKKYAKEDFAKLTGNFRDTKYNYTMEKMVNVIGEYCTFPTIEKAVFFKRIFYFFLTGNEEMHLMNFSVITNAGKTTLAPVDDFLNSSISIKNPHEELAKIYCR